jgi:hypothetical protein
MGADDELSGGVLAEIGSLVNNKYLLLFLELMKKCEQLQRKEKKRGKNCAKKAKLVNKSGACLDNYYISL